MKKVLLTFAAASMLAVIACGPSAAEKKAAEQKIKDSLEAVRLQDSMTTAAANQMKMDTTKVDSTAATAAPAPAEKK